MNNLANDPEVAELKQEMKIRMETMLKEQQDPRMDGKGEVFDSYGYSEEKAWHFYERFMSGEFTPAQTGWVNPTDYEKAPIR